MIFSKFPIIDLGNGFILREFSHDDVQEYFELYSIPEVNKYIPDSMIPKTLEDTALEIESIIQSFKSEYTIYWAIAEKSTNKLIGGCGFHDWNKFNFRIEIAYDIHPNYWRKGIMHKSLQEIIKFAFIKMKVVRIQATALEENIPSINLLSKLGFKKEGILYKYKFFKRKMVDIVMLSYTIDDFFNHIKNK